MQKKRQKFLSNDNIFSENNALESFFKSRDSLIQKYQVNKKL